MTKSIVLAASITFAGAAALIGHTSIAGSGAATPSDRRVGGDTSSALPGLTTQPIAGADVICGQITGPQVWGGLGGISSYSLGTTSCNIGTVALNWFQSNNQHPVMPQNIYRYKVVNGAGQFDQIGQSWLKHSFCALQGTICSSCTVFCGGCCDHLGIGCSDPYSPSRNGQQSLMGSRAEINASTGVFPYPAIAGSMSGDVLFKRIQVANTDLDPALNPGAQYFGEAQYVSNQDASAGNNNNNASWVKMAVGSLTGSVPNQFYTMSFTSGTNQMQPAINGWKTIDAAVTLVNVDVPSDGRFVLGYKATPIAGGMTHYEYAIYNYNSHRSLEKFIVPVPAGVNVSNIGFHFVPYHSQSVLPATMQVDNLPWTSSLSGGSLTWSTTAYSAAVDGTANALRWGTMDTFRFDADQPPVTASATFDPFRPGLPSTVSVNVDAPGAPPSCPTDLTGGGCTNGIDLAMFLGAWTGATPYSPCPPFAAADFNHDCMTNGLDLAMLLGAWGPCAGGSCP